MNAECCLLLLYIWSLYISNPVILVPTLYHWLQVWVCEQKKIYFIFVFLDEMGMHITPNMQILYFGEVKTQVLYVIFSH